jgi:hypothetical protein
MARFSVAVYELITHVIEVEADNEAEAYELGFDEIGSSTEDLVYDRVFTGDYQVVEVK